MGKGIRFVGLDVHKETITVAVAEGDGSVVEMGKIPNRPEAVRRLIKRLGRVREVAGVLRGGAVRVRAVLAVSGSQRGVRSGGAESDSSGAWGSGQDGPAGREEAGDDVPGGVVDGGLGTGWGARGVAGPGASSGGCEEGRASSSASAGEVFAAQRTSGARRGQGLGESAQPVVGWSRVRASGAGGGFPRLPA